MKKDGRKRQSEKVRAKAKVSDRVHAEAFFLRHLVRESFSKDVKSNNKIEQRKERVNVNRGWQPT